MLRKEAKKMVFLSSKIPYLGLSPKKTRFFLRPSPNDPINPQEMIPVRRHIIVTRNNVSIYLQSLTFLSLWYGFNLT